MCTGEEGLEWRRTRSRCELVCCPEEGGTRLQAGSGAMPPLPTKMVPARGVKCCVGQSSGREGLLHHKKVSAVELPPGVSGLTSTLTQATFSWLFQTERGDRRRKDGCQSDFMMVVRMESTCRREILSGRRVLDNAQSMMLSEYDFNTRALLMTGLV